MFQIVTPDGQVFSTPHDFTPEQARSMAAATTVQTYSDGERDYVTVLTRCGTVREEDDGFFWDGNWVDWVPAAHPGWTWLSGTGEHDDGGEWFAQEHRLDTSPVPFIWVAVGWRPHRDEQTEDAFGALIDALKARGIESEVIPTGGGIDRLEVIVGGLSCLFSDEHTSPILYEDDEWFQIDPPEDMQAEIDGWTPDLAARVAEWFDREVWHQQDRWVHALRSQEV